MLVNGKWGAGKTSFIKNFVTKKEADSDVRFLYVSVNGMTGISDIQEEFFNILHPVLSSKILKNGAKVLKGTLKAAIKIDWDDDGKADGTVTGGIPEFEIRKWLEKFDGKVLIFDDVERSGMPIGELFGYINHFVEHAGAKVILISNEKNVGGKEDDDGNSYSKIKEKLVGQTIKIAPDFNAAFSSFVSNITDSDIRLVLVNNEAIVFEAFVASKCENLRLLSRAIMDFERFYRALPNSAYAKEKLMRELLKELLVYSIELRVDNRNAEKLVDLERTHFFSTGENDKAKEVNELINCLRKKYSSFEFHSSIFLPKFWVAFIVGGLIPSELNTVVTSTPHYLSNKWPSWKSLWHSYLLSEEDFQSALNDVDEKLKSGHYKIVGEFYLVVSTKLMLCAHDLIQESSNDIFDQSKLLINGLLEDGYLGEDSQDLSGSWNGSGYGGLGFYEDESGVFRKIMSYMNVARKTGVERSYTIVADTLLDLLVNDYDVFLQMLTAGIPGQGKYAGVPILKNISSDDFMLKVVQMPPKDRIDVCGFIHMRYTDTPYILNLRPEKEWLAEILELVRTQIEVENKTPTKISLTYLKQNVEEAISVLK